MSRSLKEDELGRDLRQCKERKRIRPSRKLRLVDGVLPGGASADPEALPGGQGPGRQRPLAAGRPRPRRPRPLCSKELEKPSVVLSHPGTETHLRVLSSSVSPS